MIHKTLIETVASCIPTQDGNWLVTTTSGQIASSPRELKPGDPVTVREPVNHGRQAERPLILSSFPARAAVACLEAIDRVRS